MSAAQLSIGGILSVSLLNGFMPAVGTSFDLLDWGTLSGTFSSLGLPTLSTGQWDTSQLYTTGVLSVIQKRSPAIITATASSMPLITSLGGTASAPSTRKPITTSRTNFGDAAAAGSGSQTINGQTSAVPEPATILLGLLSLGYLAAAGRGRGRT